MRNRNPRPAPHRPILLGLAVGLLLLAGSLPVAAETDVRVRYRSADTVYLDNGSDAGLAVGDQLELSRGGRLVARLEVIFVARRSASCSVTEELQSIEVGDQVRWPGGESPEVDASQVETPASPAPAAAAASAVGKPYDPSVTPDAGSYIRSRPRRTRLGGTLSLDYESFSDGSDRGDFDYTRLVGRVNFRARDIGGSHFDVRLRLRSQEIDRDRETGAGISPTETQDRFYELSLIYDRPDARYGFRLGRLGSSPFMGVGYLDGALGHYQISRSFALGGFFGAASDVQDLGFQNRGQKYGVFTRFSSQSTVARRPFELYLAGVREDGDIDVSREYLAMETRWDGSSIWSFYQRAEVDLNRDWRKELSDSSSQLSNFSLATTARVTDSSRFVISYNMYQRYRTEETRFIPDELFNDILRQGLRLSYRHSGRSSLSYTVDAGMRDQDDDSDGSYYFGGSVLHPDIGAGFSLGGNVLAFSNPYTEGFLVRLRSGKRFGNGHRVDLDLGGRMSQYVTSEDQDDTTYQWVRLSGWFELPARLFARAEFEYTTGDELQGQRLTLGLGYRF